MHPSLMSGILRQISDLLKAIPSDDYCRPLASLSMSSIGEHIRHILDMFMCLNQAYKSGILNYDLRERDQNIQCNPALAAAVLSDIIINLHKPDKGMMMESLYINDEEQIPTTYQRETLYCLEHCIHHQALIKVGLKEIGLDKLVQSTFGVAPSTLAYKSYVHG